MNAIDCYLEALKALPEDKTPLVLMGNISAVCSEMSRHAEALAICK